MSKHYLEPLFSPKAIAVFGTNHIENSKGYILFKNLIEGGYTGDLYAITTEYDTLLDRPTYKSLRECGKPIDLALITTPVNALPAIIESCGEYGIKAAAILSAGFTEMGIHNSNRLEKKITSIAKKYDLRILGPKSLGIQRPAINLNATSLKSMSRPGCLALVSQSDALCAVVVDWAIPNDIGFSIVISVGTPIDLDFGEILDYLVTDPHIQGILLYIESIRHARSFMSGLRAAARMKPVIVLKSGRRENVIPAAKPHGSILIGQDDTFDAALQRAGVVRVYNFGQLFAAAKTYAHIASRYKAQGNRLAIVTNGNGPDIMAADRAAALNIPLAQLSKTTLAALNQELSPAWSHSNPIDMTEEASVDCYRKVVSICLQDPDIDAVLVILTTQAYTDPLITAKIMIELAEQSPKPLLACWMGGSTLESSRNLFSEAQLPEFRTPESALEGFAYLYAYQQNQQLLLQTPGQLENIDRPDVEGAQIIVESVLAERRTVLTEMESKAILGAFRIPVVHSGIARHSNEALVLAEAMGFPVAMKINAPDILYKSYRGGVKLNINNAQGVRDAFKYLMQQAARCSTGACVDGVTVQPMVNKPHGRELRIAVIHDPVFGPVISFGIGGGLVEVLDDLAVSLPPLNVYLARALINKTRAAKLLGCFQNMPPVKQEALESVLVRVSEMACELPWLEEMDIDPLIIDEEGIVAVSAKIVVNYHIPSPDRYAHMAIYPYPSHLVKHWRLPNGTDVTIRPIRPEDADLEQEFTKNLSQESRYFRFMQSLQELSPTMLVRLTQIDYDREMALVAVTEQDGKECELGTARYAINPDGESCEFALVISDQWQHRGIAQRLMTSLMDAARTKGLKVMQGDVLTNNQNMLKLMNKLGFMVIVDEEERTLTRVSKNL